MTKLIVFDCDGTLVDSQFIITEAMNRALTTHSFPPMEREQVRRVVGLSLVEAVATLIPQESEESHVSVAHDYKNAFQSLRGDPAHHEPLFPGADEIIRELGGGLNHLGLATGKSRRGVNVVLALHGWDGLFDTIQTADDGPGKPHPYMLEQAILETGASPDRAVMIGDTTFDMEMARSAGVRAIGVDWGYHSSEELIDSGAEIVIKDFAQLKKALD